MVLPEITIKGAATLNGNNYKVIGRLDMLVIKPDGEIHIVDYKCSPKEYDKYNDAKKLTFEY
jgi:RecB family exonuclease